MKLEIIEARQDRGCPVCGDGMRKLLDLKRYPLTEIFEPYREDIFDNTGFADQGFLYCERCGHGKLETVISKEFLYRHYRTATSGSIGALSAVRNFHAFVTEHVDARKLDAIVDIGANDATLLDSFADHEKQLVAIDPNAGADSHPGVTVMRDFIENVDLSPLRAARKLILCSHTIEHIEAPLALLARLHIAMGSEDVCAFQFPSLDLLVRDARFDQIHHQHIHYFSRRSISLMLSKAGFGPVALRFDGDHYGALMVLFRKLEGRTGESPAAAIPLGLIEAQKKVFDLEIGAANLRIEKNPEPMVAFGAALMLPLVAFHLPALERIECIVDDDRSKEGLRFINFNKRIVHSDGFRFDGKDVVVTAISTKLALRRVVEKLFKLGIGNIIVPLNRI